MKILGLSAFAHDSAAALVVDGQVISAVEEERLSRTKHDGGLPIHAVRACLEAGGLSMADLDLVVLHEKPLDKFERLLVSQLRSFPRSGRQFVRAMGTWLSDRLWQREAIVRALGCRTRDVVFAEHHLSHAASAYYASPFEEAAVVTVDGVGEWATTALYHGRGVELVPLAELHFPHSIGLVYSALTAFLGFEVNDGEYKVMGLAAYGQPRFLDALRGVCRVEPDGALVVDPRCFAWAHDAESSYTPALERLLGPARRPGAPLVLPAAPGSDSARWADVAASAQALLEEYLLTLIGEAHRRTGARALALAGGVALNAVANRKLLEQGPFEALYVQPAAGDAGGALGAALWAAHTLGRDDRAGPRRADVAAQSSARRSPGLTTPFLGPACAPAEVRRFLDDVALPYTRPEALHATVAERLARGQVGGWVRGRAEWGPRALGARSILADPRADHVKDHLNRKVKLREPFRPFAPAVLEDEAARWFVPASGKQDLTTSLMCSVAPATAEARAQLPAVVHVDGTARVQHVSASSDLGHLLTEFRQRTGVGVLLNTSFNLAGEPMVGSVAEACSTFLRSELDFLVVEDCVVQRSAP